MGDRANFGLKHSNGDVLFVYAHIGGYEMLSNFANAILVARTADRLNDEAYGTRIIIQALMEDAYSPVLGYGITMNELCDNEHKVPVLDFAKGTVTLYDMDNGYGFDHPLVTFGVDRFIDKYAK